MIAAGPGDVLCFLPGAREIGRALQDVRGSAGAATSTSAAARIARRGRAGRRHRCLLRGPRVILATNIAETSLTVPGVPLVVDRGCRRSRATTRIAPSTASCSNASPPTRPSSAPAAPGAIGAGRAWRLWDAARSAASAPRARGRSRRSRVRRARPAWLGGNRRSASSGSRRRPPQAREAAPSSCWSAWGRSRATALTPSGHQLRRLPLHPRLACVLIAAGGACGGGRLRAALGEPFPAAASGATTLRSVGR